MPISVGGRRWIYESVLYGLTFEFDAYLHPGKIGMALTARFFGIYAYIWLESYPRQNTA
jgi:hypothetical protein